METSLSTMGAGREGGSDGAGGTLTTAAPDGVPSIWQAALCLYYRRQNGWIGKESKINRLCKRDEDGSPTIRHTQTQYSTSTWRRLISTRASTSHSWSKTALALRNEHATGFMQVNMPGIEAGSLVASK